MIRQLFKLIWNRKRKSLMLIVEIFFCCYVVFNISALMTSRLKNYLKPLGFEYDNRLTLTVYWPVLPEDDAANKARLRDRYISISKELGNFKEIEMFDWCSNNMPYSGNFSSRHVESNFASVQTYSFDAGDNFLATAGLQLVKGRWFDKSDDTPGTPPVVITQQLERALFGQESGLGKHFGHKGRGWKVVGVVADYRSMGEYGNDVNCMFSRCLLADTTAAITGHYLLKQRPGNGPSLENRIVRRIKALYPDANVQISNMEEQRNAYLSSTTNKSVIACIIAVFLILNVALGLFGILWYTITRRRGEIGLRRALGADKRMIALQIVGEVLVLSTVSIALGVVFEAQIAIVDLFQFETIVYVIGILASILFIYLLTAACALYPAYLASGIDAAAALHDE